jgi:hypothetical protein
VLQTAGTFRGDVLAAFVDVGLDHDSDDGAITGVELLADLSNHFGLVSVVLQGWMRVDQYKMMGRGKEDILRLTIPVGAVDHDGCRSFGTSFGDGLADDLD